MDIALLNQKVTFQKSEVVTDEIGNRKSGWSDYFTCHATISGEGGDEVYAAGTVIDKADMAVTVRYCKKTAAIKPTGFRLMHAGDAYNILAVDHLSYKRKAVKFKCKKERE